MPQPCDLLIVGGGPAGLSAAINGASEGLRVCIIDAAAQLGGQARESNSIENYPMPAGHEDGVTGNDLMAGFIAQAKRFHTDLFCPVMAQQLRVDKDRIVLTTSDYEEYPARSVLLANGLSYRRHTATGIGALMGRGVWYGLPSLPPSGKKTYAVVGGANSAGQAALRLAKSAKTVRLITRHSIEDQMSTYLVDRIRSSPNIEIRTGEITAVEGDRWITAVHLSTYGFPLSVDGLFIFIGASPRTLWLSGTGVELDDKKFIKTDVTLDTEDHNARLVLPFETSLPGVFAAGDVRAGSTKRIAAAIGEGAAALQSIHRYLAAKES